MTESERFGREKPVLIGSLAPNVEQMRSLYLENAFVLAVLVDQIFFVPSDRVGDVAVAVTAVDRFRVGGSEHAVVRVLFGHLQREKRGRVTR